VDALSNIHDLTIGREATTGVTLFSLTPGLFTQLTDHLRLVAGARVWWDMSGTITSGAPGVYRSFRSTSCFRCQASRSLLCPTRIELQRSSLGIVDGGRYLHRREG